LCDRIIANVSNSAFNSEEYLNELKHGYVVEDKQTNILHAHEHTTGGFVSGEVKLALTLRLLAGGSYMDLALLFDVGFSTAYEILHTVIKEWILDDRLVKINGVDYCHDEEHMAKVAGEFAKRSNCVINGCIGAIDGWIVKIRKPSRTKDLYNASDPKSYFSCKGFFGINVQAIVDRKKRITNRPGANLHHPKSINDNDLLLAGATWPDCMQPPKRSLLQFPLPSSLSIPNANQINQVQQSLPSDSTLFWPVKRSHLPTKMSSNAVGHRMSSQHNLSIATT
jgi:hypothetical protein